MEFTPNPGSMPPAEPIIHEGEVLVRHGGPKARVFEHDVRKADAVIRTLRQLQQEENEARAAEAKARAEREAKRAEAAQIQARLDSLVAQRAGLRELVSRAEGAIQLVEERLKVLEGELSWRWQEGKSLEDHLREVALREAEAKRLPGWLETHRTALANVTQELDALAKVHGVAVPD